jgi:hypothetical protein
MGYTSEIIARLAGVIPLADLDRTEVQGSDFFGRVGLHQTTRPTGR